MNHAVFIKTPEQAETILQSTFLSKIKNYDIHFSNKKFLRHYYFPPVFVQGKHLSEIDKKTNKNHEYSKQYGLKSVD